MPKLDSSLCEVPGYRLIKQIGRGTFGYVWLAEEPASRRLVAVKVLPKSKTTDREIAGIRRFFAARLQHPAIIDIRYVGETDDAYFYAMELADDASEQHPAMDTEFAATKYQPQTLRHLMTKAGPLPPSQALDIAAQILGGLAVLHQHDLIHRDIKPENILFVHGKAKISDLGLVASSAGTVTMVGTRGYLPPDDKLDHTADLYATGRVVYEMITGLAVERFPDLPNRRIAKGKEAKAHGVAVQLFLRAAHRERKKRAESAHDLLDLLNKRRSLFKARPRGVAAVLVALIVFSGAFISHWSGGLRWGARAASQLHSSSAVLAFPLRTTDSRTPGFRLFFGDGSKQDYPTESWVRTIELSSFWFGRPCVAVGFDSTGPEAGIVKVFAEEDLARTLSPIPILQMQPRNHPPAAWDFQDHQMVCHMQVLPPLNIDGISGDELIVASHHDDGPCEIMVFGDGARQIGSYWHYGWLDSCKEIGLRDVSSPLIAFFGIANQRSSPSPPGRRDEALYSCILVLDWPTIRASKGYWGSAEWICNKSESTPYAYGTLLQPRDDTCAWCWGSAGSMEGAYGSAFRIGVKPDLQIDLKPDLSPIRCSFLPGRGREDQLPPPVETIWRRTWPNQDIR